MRPVSNFLIMQLSNSRAAEYLTGTHEFAGYTDKKEEKSTKRTIYAIIPSLTVEKKNECHNP